MPSQPPPAPAPDPAPFSSSLTPITQGNRLAPLHSHLRAHFHFPDLAALELVLCSVISHYSSPTDPVWLFVQGRSRSGKSVVAINPLVGLPKTWEVGDITPKTLISGFTKMNQNPDGTPGKKVNTSLLAQIGSSGILLFKDFTTIMSKRPDQRAEIISQFRELHDGRYSKASGMTHTMTWEGKITILAATTPAIERDWLMYRDLGERFLTVRWGAAQADDHAATLAAMDQEGSEISIAKKTKELVQRVIDYPSLANLGPLPIIPANFSNRLAALAKITSLARARVIRDSYSPRPIIDVPEPEVPTGIAKGLAALVRARARLHRRPTILRDDIDLISKIALDSVPTSRARILGWLPAEGATELSEIAKHTGIAKSSCDWHLDELAALGVTQKIKTADENVMWEFTQNFRQLWRIAYPNQAL
jgi:hypothetical protein